MEGDEEDELNLDVNDRVDGSYSQLIDFSTRVFESLISLQSIESLLADCKLTVRDELDSSFWIGSQDEPRCGLEALAQDIFKMHTRDVEQVENGGAEWWVQMRSPERATIPFHFDKDETLAAITGDVYVSPVLSTVTYLTSGGAPTCILGYRYSHSMGKVIDADRSSIMSFPSPGKHVVFDGRLLHGAPEEFTRDDSLCPRLTFLVNVWINHRPYEIDSLPFDICGLMMYKKQASLQEGEQGKISKVFLDNDECAWKNFHMKGENGMNELNIPFDLTSQQSTIALLGAAPELS